MKFKKSSKKNILKKKPKKISNRKKSNLDQSNRALYLKPLHHVSVSCFVLSTSPAIKKSSTYTVFIFPPFLLAPPVFEASQPRAHPRDIVKTPDEVADLPVHEEVDPGMYSSGEFNRDLHKHEHESKEGDIKISAPTDEAAAAAAPDSNKKSDFKETIKGEANLLDEEDTEETRKLEIVDKTIESVEDATEEKKEEIQVEPEHEGGFMAPADEAKALEKEDKKALTTKYLDIIDQLEKTSDSTDREKIALEKDSKSGVAQDEPRKDEKPAVELNKEEKTDPSPSVEKLAESFGERAASSVVQVKAISEISSPVPSDKESPRQASPSPSQKGVDEPEKETVTSSEAVLSDQKDSLGEKRASLGTDQTLGSGRSTPHLSEKDSRQPTPSPVEKEGPTPGKVTPEPGLKSEKSDSARSTPAPEAEQTSVRKSSIPSGKVSPEKMAPSTIEKSLPLKLDAAVISERLSPCLDESVPSESKSSGKTTPAPEEKFASGKETPTSEKATSGKATPTSLEKAASGKTTPLPSEKAASGRATPASSEKAASGKTTPTSLEKAASGRATPTSLEKDAHGRTTPTSSVKVFSGRTTPVERSASGKSTPLLDEREGSRKSSLAEDEKISTEQIKMTSIAENTLLGDSEAEAVAQVIESGDSVDETCAKGVSPVIPERDSSCKVSPSKSDKSGVEIVSPVPSEKDLEEKKSPDQTPPGKTTPAPSEKSASGKTSPDAIEKMSGKTSPACSDVLQASGKTTPDKIFSGKTTPHSGKTTPGKTTPDALGNVPSGQATPNVEDLILSGKGTPTASENVQADVSDLLSSGKGTPALLEKNASGKTTPDISDKAASGKITPAASEKGLSGKSTPEVIERSASGKATPAFSDKSTPGKITPVSEKGESGKVTPSDLAEKSSERRKASTPSCEKETPNRSRKQSPIESAEMEEKISPLKEKEMEKASAPVCTEKVETLSETKAGLESGQSSGKVTPAAEIEKGKDSGRSSTDGKIPPSPIDVPKPLTSAGESPDVPVASEGKASPSPALEKKLGSESSGKNTPSEKLPSGKSTPLEKLTNGIGASEDFDEPEKGILESERHEKESHVSEEISSDEDEELKALEQGDDNEDSGPEEEITRERLQSLTHGEITAATPDSVPESPAVKKITESETGLESPKLDADKEEKETPQESTAPIRKDVKDDINELVKSGGSNEGGSGSAESENHAAVKRMLVTASSEDGGTETEICAQGSIRLSKSEAGAPEDKEKRSPSPESSDADEEVKGEEAFSSLILQARKEYNLQRSRKSSCNSPERMSPDEGKDSTQKESRDEQASPNPALTEDSTDTISTEQSSVLQKTEIGKEVDTNGWAEQADSDREKKLSKTKTTSRYESSRMDEADIITITTILTEEREEQEDGTYKVTTTKEVVTKGGKEAGTVVTVDTDVIKAGDSGSKSPIAEAETKSTEKVVETAIPSGPKPTGTDETRLEREEPSSPLSVTSQLSPSPTPGFDFDDYRRSTCGYFDTKTAEEKKSSTSSTIAFTESGKSSDENAKPNLEDSSEKDRSRKSSTGSQDEKRPGSKEESEARLSQGDQELGQREESRRTSASSTISQEDLVSRKDSTRIEEFRTGSVELSPLKTTYITSHASSDSGESQLMTSSFYGALPTEDEMILSASYAAAKPEVSSEIRKGKGYESVTEIGPDGEKTERTYFYGTDPEPALTGSFYVKGIPEPIPEAPEITPDKPSFVETFPANDSFLSEEHMDFAKAVEEHKTARGEDLSKNYQFDVGKYSGDKFSSKPDDNDSEESKKFKDDIKEASSSQPETKSDGKEEKPSPEKKKDAIEGWGKPLGLPLPPKVRFLIYKPLSNLPRNRHYLVYHVIAEHESNHDFSGAKYFDDFFALDTFGQQRLRYKLGTTHELTFSGTSDGPEREHGTPHR